MDVKSNLLFFATLLFSSSILIWRENTFLDNFDFNICSSELIPLDRIISIFKVVGSSNERVPSPTLHKVIGKICDAYGN